MRESTRPLSAAAITNCTVDFSQLDPMITATLAELEQAGVSGRPGIDCQLTLDGGRAWTRA